MAKLLSQKIERCRDCPMNRLGRAFAEHNGRVEWQYYCARERYLLTLEESRVADTGIPDVCTLEDVPGDEEKDDESA